MKDPEHSKRSLDALPARINEIHQNLYVIENKLGVLDEFLFGGQGEGSPKGGKDMASGVVYECFDNLSALSQSIEDCDCLLSLIIDKLGAPNISKPCTHKIPPLSEEE